MKVSYNKQTRVAPAKAIRNISEFPSEYVVPMVIMGPG